MLRPLPGNKTRLVMRYRGLGFVAPAARAIRPDAGPVPQLVRLAVLHVPGVDLALRAFDLFVSDPLHHCMEIGMLTGIKARAEGGYAHVNGHIPTRQPPRSVGRSGVGPFGLSGPWPASEAAYVGALLGGCDMAGAIRIVLAVLCLALSAVAIGYVLGIRSKSATVRHAARRFHRAVGNPVQMRSAGAPGRYASVIRHQGRTTGRTYETPVWAVPTEDGFVIAVVYGAGTDWLKNVLASGTAAIVHDGDTYAVDQPEIVPMDSARAYFPAKIRRTQRLVRVDRCLRVRRVKDREDVRRTEPLVSGTDGDGLDCP